MKWVNRWEEPSDRCEPKVHGVTQTQKKDTDLKRKSEETTTEEKRVKELRAKNQKERRHRRDRENP